MLLNNKDIETNGELIFRVEVPSIGIRKAVRVKKSDKVSAIIDQIKKKVEIKNIENMRLFRILFEGEEWWLKNNTFMSECEPPLKNHEFLELKLVESLNLAQEEEKPDLNEESVNSGFVAECENTSGDTIEHDISLIKQDLPELQIEIPKIFISGESGDDLRSPLDSPLPEPPAPLSPEDCKLFNEKKRVSMALMVPPRELDTYVFRIDMPELGIRKAIKVKSHETVHTMLLSVLKKVNLGPSWLEGRRLYRPLVGSNESENFLDFSMVIGNCEPPFSQHEFMELKRVKDENLVVETHKSLINFHTPEPSDDEGSSPRLAIETHFMEQQLKSMRIARKLNSPEIKPQSAVVENVSSPERPKKLTKKKSLNSWKKIKKNLKKKNETYTEKTPPSQGIFGTSINNWPLNDDGIPIIVENILTFLELNDMTTEGLFRLSGAVSTIAKLKEYLDLYSAKEIVKWEPSLKDPHAAAGCLKCLLREMPDPLLTYKLFDCWIAAQSNDSKKLLYYYHLVNSLPQRNMKLLQRLTEFFYNLSLYGKQNKMSIQNLATVIGPNIMKPKSEPELLLQTGPINKVALDLIQYSSVLFLPVHEFYSQNPQFNNQQFVKLAKAIYPYKPRYSDYFEDDEEERLKELVFNPGDIIFIESTVPFENDVNSGWWLGEILLSGNKTRRGILPSNYVTVIYSFNEN